MSSHFSTYVVCNDPDRLKFWEETLGLTEMPVKSPLPQIVLIPDHGIDLVYMLDVAALTAEQKTKLIHGLADKFSLPVASVEVDFDKNGCPILVKDTTLFSNQLWFLE